MLTIRPATLADAAAIAEVHVASPASTKVETIGGKPLTELALGWRELPIS